MSFVVRRGSFHSCQEAVADRSQWSLLRRHSEDSHKLMETYHAESSETLLMSSLGSGIRKVKDRANNSMKQPERRLHTENAASPKKPNRGLKSILKKQSTAERISYSNMISLFTAECNNDSNERPADDMGEPDGASFPPAIRPVTTKAQHNRRVRFNENVSFRFSESDAMCLLEDCLDETNKTDCVTVESMRHLDSEQTTRSEATLHRNERSDTKLPDASQRLAQERTKLKKDTRVEPVTKRSRLTSCGNFVLTSKTAWAKPDTVSASDEPHVKKSVERKQRANIPVCGRGLDRSKTDIGLVSYKDVQSKLRRMGFLDFNNSLSGRKNAKHNSKFEHCAENDKRNNCKYSTVREEFFDIRNHNGIHEISPVRHMTRTCAEAGIRSLGDEYAQFLKGRYKVDDITCS